ncbi:MAG TPA: PhzF family phenazine biosynthesis protein [Gemmatimonadales bacterium]|jgi:PhzF family phenazine biosynthesis protein|nr:PhzF family phenazine biosynthesis protein [Gemmatimonadales bacterium]
MTPFYLVDVFATEPFTGNPLAVVADGDRFSTDLMRRIAGEFKQTETTFVLDPSMPGADWRLRSFTAAGTEVFGVGHNALGAWWWLAASGRLALDAPTRTFSQEIDGRVLPVEVRSERGRVVAVSMTQADPAFGAVVGKVSPLASALDLGDAELAAGRLEAQVVSTGVPHLLVPVRDPGALERARPKPEQLAAYLRSIGAQGCYLFCLDPLDPDSPVQARFFGPNVGIAEDPATGSAAGPLAAYLAARELASERRPVLIEQGRAMGRPSRIEVWVRGGGVRVSGTAVLVVEGHLRGAVSG